ncbi:MAG TPA: YihY/virulence factor BrkB family protein [Sunxiuqinia sp.]|nr:YihY/virulence factor BrkB family protein [Sunxiuqinia sp.]
MILSWRNHRIKRFFLKLFLWARKVSFPGFDGVALYDVVVFFYQSIIKGSITTRASAVAFSFFLALFPAIIFLFSLISYIRLENFQTELLQLIEEIVPKSTHDAIDETVKNILFKQRDGLTLFGFVTALIFATNGLASMMSAFDASLHTFQRRSWLGQRLIAIMMLFILAVLLTLAVTLITSGQFAINYLVEHGILQDTFTYYLLTFGKWVVTVALFFFAYSFLYYFAPAKKTRWRFISAGGTLATILSILTMVGFSYYITNFGRYNILYGSIGTLLVVLLLFYLMSLILLLGFELNASINEAHHHKSLGE